MAGMAVYRFCQTLRIFTGDMITRIKNYEKQTPTRDARKIYIICEGKSTEPDYFAFFQGLSSNLEIVIIPPEEGSDPLKLMDLVNRKFFDADGKYSIDYQAHDTLWFVVDTDTWEVEGKISRLREFCSNLNSEDGEVWKKYSEVKPYSVCNVTQSNPSFEIWLFYHFFAIKPVNSEVESYSTFKEYVNRVISGGFNFQKDQVKLKDAIVNSKANYDFTLVGTPELFSTEVYKLAEEILPFVRRPLERLGNKM